MSGRVPSNKLSGWWWLLLVPLFPFLLGLFFLLNGIAGGVIGPPAIWNQTWHNPPRDVLVGHYVEVERHWDKRGPDAVLDLRKDGSMKVQSLPVDLIISRCTLSGTGRWTGPDEAQKIALTVTSDGLPGSCETGSYSDLQLTGHSEPYGLYWTLGDPDSGTGLWFKKQ